METVKETKPQKQWGCLMVVETGGEEEWEALCYVPAHPQHSAVIHELNSSHFHSHSKISRGRVGQGNSPLHLVIHLLSISSGAVLGTHPSSSLLPIWTAQETKVARFLSQQGSRPSSQTCAHWQGLGHRVQASSFYQPLLRFCTWSPGVRPAPISPGKLP